MKRTFFVFLFCLPLMVNGQEAPFRRVPRQISLDGSYRLVAGSQLPNKATNGYGFMLDYAWQLSGFNGGKAAFISVPLGYSQMLPDNDSMVSARIISYGWTVRHELRKQDGLVPYIGYGLLLNNYKESGIDGHRFAHQTRFSVGLNQYGKSSIQPYAELDYSMSYYPQMGVKKSQSYHFVELKIGARFMKRNS